MITFLDASALVKNYIEEDGSSEVRGCLASTLPAISRLTLVEVASALARRCREGDLSTWDRDRLLADLREDADALYLLELAPEVVSSAQELLVRHPLRAADAIQLSSCLVLQRWMARPVSFAAFDRRLLDAAEQEGLDTVRPA